MKTNKLKKRVLTIIALVFMSGYFVSCSQEELSDDYTNDIELVVEEDAPVNASKNSCSNISKVDINSYKDSRYGHEGYSSKLYFKIKNRSSKTLDLDDITFRCYYEGYLGGGGSAPATKVTKTLYKTFKGGGDLKKQKRRSITIDNGNVGPLPLRDLDMIDNSTGCSVDLNINK